jgi:peptide/nickel transport system substrate-binding protein
VAQAACERIKAHVEGLFKDAPAGNKLTLDLDPRAPREFLRHVESEQRYELAYLPFDYPDDWHPFGLAAFLDPDAAGRDGRNVTGYLSANTNPDAEDRILGGELAAFREHRDYAGDLAPRAQRVHTQFNDRMPFVPLWQLDRHTLVSGKLRVVVDDSTDVVPAYLLNPTGLFQNAARWKLE